MRRLCAVALVSALVVVCSAAGLAWKRVPLEAAGGGIMFLPYSWNVIAESSPVTENAYGPGISGRSLLTAQEGYTSLSVLTYWPAVAKTTREIARDVDNAIAGYASTQDNFGDMKFGDIRASSVTSRVDSDSNRKVTAFIHGGKIYCLVLTYPPSEEYKCYTLIRGIISKWRF